jgi:hypothetical protein
MGSNSHVALRHRYLQGHRPETGLMLTNRMSELLTYGSVGGVGRKPGPYPAHERRESVPIPVGDHWRGVGEPQR